MGGDNICTAARQSVHARVDFFQAFKKLFLFGRGVLGFFNLPPQFKHFGVGARNYVGAVFKARLNVGLVGDALFVFQLVFKARPEVHGDGAYLHFNVDLFFALGKNTGMRTIRCRLLYPFGLGFLM